MHAEDFVCWKCGASLAEVPMPLSRMSECLDCRAELHVCLMCEFHDPKLAQACSEPMAEEVKDKTRANFCDFFVPAPDAHAGGADSGADSTQAALASLFGESGDDQGDTVVTDAPEDEERRRLDNLFGGDD